MYVHAKRKAGQICEGSPWCFDFDQNAKRWKTMQASGSRFDSGRSFDLRTKAAQSVQPARQSKLKLLLQDLVWTELQQTQLQTQQPRLLLLTALVPSRSKQHPLSLALLWNKLALETTLTQVQANCQLVKLKKITGWCMLQGTLMGNPKLNG